MSCALREHALCHNPLLFFFLMMSIGPSQRAALASETTAGPHRPRGRACFCQAQQRAAAGRAVAPGRLGASRGPPV